MENTMHTTSSKKGIKRLLVLLGSFGLLAGACCWLPMLLLALGLGGAGLGAIFESLRPFLIVATLAVLGYAFYLLYIKKPRELKSLLSLSAQASAGAPEGIPTFCGCETPVGETGPRYSESVQDGKEFCCSIPAVSQTLKRQRILFWGVSALSLGFLTFPYYAPFLVGSSPSKPLLSSSPQAGSTLKSPSAFLYTSTVKIDGMDCEACAAFIQKKLSALPEVVGVEVSYSHKQARFEWASPPSPVVKQKILKTLKRLGYPGIFLEEETSIPYFHNDTSKSR